MSSSPPRDPVDDTEKSPLQDDELEHSAPSNEPEPGTSTSLPKRGRGRPKGSKNKKGLPGGAPATPAVPKKRGRPPKEKKETDVEPPPKRPRGRPRKNPLPEVAAVTAAAAAASSGGEGSAANSRRRGRPPKNRPATT